MDRGVGASRPRQSRTTWGAQAVISLRCDRAGWVRGGWQRTRSCAGKHTGPRGCRRSQLERAQPSYLEQAQARTPQRRGAGGRRDGRGGHRESSTAETRGRRTLAGPPSPEPEMGGCGVGGVVGRSRGRGEGAGHWFFPTVAPSVDCSRRDVILPRTASSDPLADLPQSGGAGSSPTQTTNES